MKANPDKSGVEVSTTLVLLVDIGNTNLKWCRLNDGGLGTIRSACHRQRQLPELAEECWAELPVPQQMVVSNVAGPELGMALTDWVQQQWNFTPRFVQPEVQAHGVRNGYERIEQLGIDRWLALIAVHDRFDSPVCIVDCGTAITVDVIRADGQHLGGLILPGIDLMRDALLTRTNIPRVSATREIPLLGTDTETAVASASVHSAAALIERVMERYAEKLGLPPILIMTGSDAPRLDGVLNVDSHTLPDLVMSGLALVARETAT